MSLVILRKEFLNLIQAHQDLISDLPKQVLFCAAKLIQYFSHWTGWKVAAQRTRWIYQPLKKIYEDLMGEHSLHVIRAAIALLEKLGLIEKRHNPNGQDKTWQYKLNKDTLSNLLNIEARSAELSSAIADYEKLCDGVSTPQLFFEHGTFKAEHGENNVEQHTQDQSTDIKSTTNVRVEQKTESRGEEELTYKVNEAEMRELRGDTLAANSLPITKDKEPLSCTLPTTPAIPTESELKEVSRQLRELRVNPDSCRGLIRKYWANVPGALAFLKTATWAHSPVAVFIDACKKGLTPPIEELPRSSIPIEVRPPTSEQIEALVTAKSQKKIYDYFFSGDGITKVVFFNGIQLPWWKFLEDSASAN